MHVSRAYLMAEHTQRVIADSRGRVFVDGDWIPAPGPVVKVGLPYYTWSDVPVAWAGCAPWWR